MGPGSVVTGRDSKTNCCVQLLNATAIIASVANFKFMAQIKGRIAYLLHSAYLSELIFIMKKTLASLIFLATVFGATAQKKITNELIWNSREFNADYLGGFNSMNDGEFFSGWKENRLARFTSEKQRGNRCL